MQSDFRNTMRSAGSADSQPLKQSPLMTVFHPLQTLAPTLYATLGMQIVAIYQADGCGSVSEVQDGELFTFPPTLGDMNRQADVVFDEILD